MKLDSAKRKPFFIKTDNTIYTGMQYQIAWIKLYFTRHTTKTSGNHLQATWKYLPRDIKYFSIYFLSLFTTLASEGAPRLLSWDQSGHHHKLLYTRELPQFSESFSPYRTSTKSAYATLTYWATSALRHPQIPLVNSSHLIHQVPFTAF